MAKKKIGYKEPSAYMPKEILDKYFGDDKKKTTSKKTGAKKK